MMSDEPFFCQYRVNYPRVDLYDEFLKGLTEGPQDR